MSAKAPRKGHMPVAAANSGARGNEICLRLYVASTTPNSERAKANLDAALRDSSASPGIASSSLMFSPTQNVRSPTM
jgi:hypothetical protein